MTLVPVFVHADNGEAYATEVIYGPDGQFKIILDDDEPDYLVLPVRRRKKGEPRNAPRVDPSIVIGRHKLPIARVRFSDRYSKETQQSFEITWKPWQPLPAALFETMAPIRSARQAIGGAVHIGASSKRIRGWQKKLEESPHHEVQSLHRRHEGRRSSDRHHSKP